MQLQDYFPGLNHLIGIGRPDHDQARHGTHVRQLFDRLVGWPVLPYSNGIVSEHINYRDDPAFRTEELSYAVSLIARNTELTAAAERRSWQERWLGRQPEVRRGRVSAARERITSYLEPHSVWLHNSLRGAAGLGLAVLAARLTGVQHSFWVVLGALSVLRSMR